MMATEYEIVFPDFKWTYDELNVDFPTSSYSAFMYLIFFVSSPELSEFSVSKI